MPVEPKGSCHHLSEEQAHHVREGMYTSFEEAIKAAEQAVQPSDGTHVRIIVLSADGSIEVVTTNHLPGDTIFSYTDHL